MALTQEQVKANTQYLIHLIQNDPDVTNENAAGVILDQVNAAASEYGVELPSADPSTLAALLQVFENPGAIPEEQDGFLGDLRRRLSNLYESEGAVDWAYDDEDDAEAARAISIEDIIAKAREAYELERIAEAFVEAETTAEVEVSSPEPDLSVPPPEPIPDLEAPEVEPSPDGAFKSEGQQHADIALQIAKSGEFSEDAIERMQAWVAQQVETLQLVQEETGFNTENIVNDLVNGVHDAISAHMDASHTAAPVSGEAEATSLLDDPAPMSPAPSPAAGGFAKSEREQELEAQRQSSDPEETMGPDPFRR